MTSKRIDDLTILDWDDTALVKAYNRGMSLRVDDFKEVPRDQKSNSKNEEFQWAVGDYCRAVYPSDNLVYEAKVVAVSGDACTVDFLGYDEEVEVDADTLSKSKGKVARKKQIKKAKEYCAESAEECASGDESRNGYSDIQSPRQQKRETVHMNHGKHVDHFGDHTAAESTFQHTMYPAPAHFSGVQSATQAMMPPPPPMLHGADVAQNPSLCAMLSSWYMAGYYTGLHQAQKNQYQRCCCRPTQNCCHH